MPFKQFERWVEKGQRKGILRRGIETDKGRAVEGRSGQISCYSHGVGAGVSSG